MSMTHKQRFARRQKMAAALENGQTPQRVARRYSCSLGLVMEVARTNGKWKDLDCDARYCKNNF